MDFLATFKQYFNQWFMLLPFSRKETYARVFTAPSSVSAYAEGTSIRQGIFDWGTAFLPMHFFSILNYVIVAAINPLFTFTFVWAYAFAIPLFSLVQLFLLSGLEFVLARFLGGKGNYHVHFGLTSLASASSGLATLPLYAGIVLLGNIPFVNCISCLLFPLILGVTLWSFYMRTHSIAAAHSMGMGMATIVFILSALVFLAAFIAIYIAFIIPLLVQIMPGLAVPTSGIGPS